MISYLLKITFPFVAVCRPTYESVRVNVFHVVENSYPDSYQLFLFSVVKFSEVKVRDSKVVR